MIFIPVEDVTEEDLAAPQVEMITMNAIQMTYDGYEITSPTAKELTDYMPILEQLVETLKPSDRMYSSVEWIKKRNCIVLVTEDVEAKIEHLSGKGLTANYEKIEEKIWEETHQYITDRSEFEGIADIMSECIKGNDRFYLGFDWKERRNAILWSTNDPNDRGLCVKDKGVAMATKA